MDKKFGRSPSPALVISIIALVFAITGTAVAASKLVSGDSLIKKNSLSGNRLVNGSVTGKQINLATLGKVPNAANAETAGSAPISNVTYVTTTDTIQPTTQLPSQVTATCSQGTTVIGGGANVSSNLYELVVDSYPVGTSGWSADIINGANSSLSATVTAICAPAAATTP